MNTAKQYKVLKESKSQEILEFMQDLINNKGKTEQSAIDFAKKEFGIRQEEAEAILYNEPKVESNQSKSQYLKLKETVNIGGRIVEAGEIVAIVKESQDSVKTERILKDYAVSQKMKIKESLEDKAKEIANVTTEDEFGASLYKAIGNKNYLELVSPIADSLETSDMSRKDSLKAADKVLYKRLKESYDWDDIVQMAKDEKVKVLLKEQNININNVEIGKVYYHDGVAVEALDTGPYKIYVREVGSGREYSVYGDELTESNKKENKNILNESYDWEDIVDIAKKEKLNPKVIGFVNFIDKNKDKYKKDIKNFVDWWNESLSDADINTIEKLIVKNDPEETGFDNLPKEDWKFYTKYA